MSLQTKMETKIKDPISIKLSKNSNVILGNKFSDKDYPLVPVTMINGSHIEECYGLNSSEVEEYFIVQKEKYVRRLKYAFLEIYKK